MFNVHCYGVILVASL